MQDHVAEIKARMSIEDLVSQYVVLKRLGNSLKGLCPFHSEKTPSFVVSPEKGIAYCFGCNKGGDIFRFLMEVEGIDFGEALKLLAEKTGIVLEKANSKTYIKKSDKDAIFDLLKKTAEYYSDNLWNTEEGIKALGYIRSRGLTDDNIKKFQIGYAPDSYEQTNEYLLKAGFSKDQLLKGGIVQVKDTSMNKIFDRFRGRLIFPVWDSLGRVVGFGGRALAKDQEPKYLNSPETLVYQKSQLLYAFFQAKDFIKKSQTVVVVEGYMDALAAWQNGLKNVVAVNGTALTKRQLTLLKPYVKDLILSFDMDGAGQEAARRGFELTQDFEFTVKALTLAEGKDIADFAKENPDKIADLPLQAKLFTDYFYETLLKKYDANLLSDKKKIISEFASFFMRLKSSVEKDQYVRKLGADLGVNEHLVYDELNNLKLAKDHPAKLLDEPQLSAKKMSMEEILIGLMLQYGKVFSEISIDMSQSIFSEKVKAIYNKIVDYYNQPGSQAVEKDQSFSHIIAEWPEEWKEQFAYLSLYIEQKYANLPLDAVKKEALEIILKMRTAYFRKEKDLLHRQLQEAEQAEDLGKMSEILAKLNQISAK